MSTMQISQLLQRASTDIEDKIARYGGGSPLLADYIYFAGDLVVEAWQFRSEEEHKVTYNAVFDMIMGLQDNIGRLDDAECGISLFLMVEGLPRAAGAGVLRFADGSSKFSLNGTTSSSSNATNETTASSGASNRYQFSIRDGDTYMTVKKAGSYRRMPDLLVDTVLYNAYQDIKHRIAHYGGNTPLPDNYEYSRGGLTVAVWQNKSPEATQYKVTYQTVKDMILGLQVGLWQIENIECAVDLERVVDGGNHAIGHGSLMFQVGFSQISSNNATVLRPDNGFNRTAVNLGADRWEYHVPNTDTLLVIKKRSGGRTLPVLESLQLLDLADAKLKNIIDQQGGEDRPVDGGFLFEHQHLYLEAQDYGIPLMRLTYGITQDMVSGLKDSFWHVNYMESTVDLYRIGPGFAVNVGLGTISWPTVRPTILNGSNPRLPLPGVPNNIGDSIQLPRDLTSSA